MTSRVRRGRDSSIVDAISRGIRGRGNVVPGRGWFCQRQMRRVLSKTNRFCETSYLLLSDPISYSFRVDLPLAVAAKVILEGGNCLLFGDVFTLAVQCRGHVSKEKYEQKLFKTR